MIRSLTALALALAVAPPAAAGPLIDLTRAVVIAPPGLSGPEELAVRMLREEVEKRSLVHWERATKWPSDGTPIILVGPAKALRALLAEHGIPLPHSPPSHRAEGYRIAIEPVRNGPVIEVEGNDARGVSFGVGRLLRELRLGRLAVTLPVNFHETSAPRTPLRGHQLGYRPKTNSYDGWTVALWEQYLRDLIVFGCNTIELIPPRSDDAADSPLFPLPPLRMMVEVSRLADAYGLDVWVWYPAMGRDYSDPKTVAASLKEWGDVFRALPRLNAVFVPGGDPGHTRPTVLFDLLAKQTANLHRYHSKAQMWVSPQGFNQAWLDEFFGLLRKEPPWLTGVVYGPQVRLDLPEFRKQVPAHYPIRDYPDITHSRHCQYPVPDWDVAFALTEGREISNPRPRGMAAIVRHNRPHTIGFITYSEGCHDDVNKMIWSALGWDERTDVREVLRQYARYFIGPAFEERFAKGLLDLERDWAGPALPNAGISRTLKLFQEMERAAGPRQKLNWRFQQALYRAYYDAYVRARLCHEFGRYGMALAKLREAHQLGSPRALSEADTELNRTKEQVAPELRERLLVLAEALFQSIRVQLSVRKYHAIAVERGANLDTIDVPLTDAAWLKKQLAAIRALPGEPTRLACIDTLLHRTDPGPGGFYDELGDPMRRPHLVRATAWENDPAFYTTPLTGFGFRGFGPGPDVPRAWWHHAEELYDAPLAMRYTGLDPKAEYRVRVVYNLDRLARVRLVANGRFPIHDYLRRPHQLLEFDVPAAATAQGELTLRWNQEPGNGGSGRGGQVAEVWLIKKPGKRDTHPPG